MKFRILIFFVWVFCFNIVSSYRQYQDFGTEYQQHPDRPIHTNYARNNPVYPAHSQSFNHAGTSHVSNYALDPEPQYVPHHQPETFVEKDPRVYENIADSSVQSQAKSSYVEHKPLVYIHELPRPYPVDKTFELHVPPAEHVYRPDYTQHVAKPWVSQNIYQPTVHQKPYHEPPVHQEPYHQPMVYSEAHSSVYQHPPPLQHAQPQHPPPPQHAQPQHPPPSQHAQPQFPPPLQHPKPHPQPTHQQTYYKSQPSYDVPVAHAQAQAYDTSETNVADILASKPEVKDNLESALLKHYQLDDLGNSHHVKSSDVKLEDNDNDIERTTEKPYNTHHNNKQFPKQLLDNDVNQNKKLYITQKNKIVNSVPEETKNKTIPTKNYDEETFYHPRFAYLNHNEYPTEVNTFPIEVKPVKPHHYRNPIVKHHPYAKHPNNILVNEQQKPAVPPNPLGNMDDSYPIEPPHTEIIETSTLKNKEVSLYDYDVSAYEQHSKQQPEPKPYADKLHPENDYIPTIENFKIPSHSIPTDQIIIDHPVDKSVDTSSHGINKPKDSFDDVTPLLFYSDTIDDAKAPLIASPDFNFDKPNKEFDPDLKKQTEVAKPTIDTNNGDVVTDPIVPQKDDSVIRFVTKIDVTKANKTKDQKQTINVNVSDNGDEQQKAESEPRLTLPKDIAKQYPIEGSPLNAESPTDDGTSTEDENSQNDESTSGEIDPNNNGDDEEAADSKNEINAVLLSSIDLWEKLFLKQPNLELQAFDVVTLSPIVEKTSRLFAFPNHTTVEESVETVWERKGDVIPLEIKLTTIIKNPKQEHPDAVESNKNEQDQTKCE